MLVRKSPRKVSAMNAATADNIDTHASEQVFDSSGKDSSNDEAAEGAEITTANLDAADSLLSPGKMLQQARIAKEMSLQQVADALHLSLRWVQDIETDQFARAPAIIYIRGYLRAYARLVDLPANEVLDAFAAQGWQESGLKDDQDWLRSMGKDSQRQRLQVFYRYLRYGFAAISAVILVSLIVMWWYVEQHRMKVAALTVTKKLLLKHNVIVKHNSHLDAVYKVKNPGDHVKR